MGEVRPHRPVLQVVAVFSRQQAAMQWARQRCCDAWGPVALESPEFAFEETNYYRDSMGPGLRKMLVAYQRLIDPAELVQRKLQANQWEQEYAGDHEHAEVRPVNIDPGYLTEAKLVLATTKDRDHRIYLDRGIFAETTLFFHAGHWEVRPWTYPDYHRPDYHEFLVACRDYLRRQLKNR